jgi:hypothetical protein
MPPITPPQLWSFLRHPSDGYASYQADSAGEAPETLLSAEQFTYLATQDVKPIMVDQYASESHPGGEAFVSVVEGVLAAQHEGYQVITWYGPDAEVLIAGFRPDAQIGWPAATEAVSLSVSRSRPWAWSVHVYRKLCRVDALDRAQGRVGVQRFEYLSGTEADMRFYFEEFKANPQVLAVELHGHLVTVVERFDRLLDLLPDVDPAAAREAIVEPRLLAELPVTPSRPTG